MARYIDADKGLISKIQRKTGCNFITADEIVESMQTEDVVERSECEKLLASCKVYERLIDSKEKEITELWSKIDKTINNTKVRGYDHDDIDGKPKALVRLEDVKKFLEEI